MPGFGTHYFKWLSNRHEEPLGYLHPFTFEHVIPPFILRRPLRLSSGDLHPYFYPVWDRRQRQKGAGQRVPPLATCPNDRTRRAGHARCAWRKLSFQGNSHLPGRQVNTIATVSSEIEHTYSIECAEPVSRAPLHSCRVRSATTAVQGFPSLIGSCSYPRSYSRLNRRIQAIVRRNLAYKAAAERRLTALASLKRGEELRRQRRHREADARKRYRAACRSEGERWNSFVWPWPVSCARNTEFVRHVA